MTQQTRSHREAISVVITEDDEMLRRLIKLVLDVSGEYDVVGEACDAEQSVSIVRTLQPAIVLLDLGLPGMSGLDAISLLKQVAPRTLVIVLSAHTRETMARAATDRGADGYLEKANLVSDLVPTLTAALRLGQAVP